jgi:glycosyltransferase involved in cell wall biosynthesis
MNVLWLTPDKSDNISVGRQRIADHLEAAGHRVTVRGTTPATVLRSLREIGRYDVVLGTTRGGAIAGAAIASLSRTPFIVDHIDPIRQFAANSPTPVAAVVRRLEHVAFRLADHVLYVYEEEAERVGHHARSTKTDLGVEYERFAEPDEAALGAARERLASLNRREHVAIYVGGLEPMYNVPQMLDAFECLDDWTLVVLGTGSLEDRVREAAANSTAVQYLGTVPHNEVPGYLHAADVGICLVDDPHTLKVLEYGAAGLPTVQLRGHATDRFGEFVTYTDTEPGNVANAVQLAHRSGASESFQAFVSRFRWGEIAEVYEETLANAVERGTDDD